MPLRPPLLTLAVRRAGVHRMAMVVMRHKAFVGPTMYWNARPLNENRERVREQAESFINKIGVENVISVTEQLNGLESQ